MVEGRGSWNAGNMELIADAVQMLTDVGGTVLTLFVIRFGARPATLEMTFG